MKKITRGCGRSQWTEIWRLWLAKNVIWATSLEVVVACASETISASHTSLVWILFAFFLRRTPSARFPRCRKAGLCWSFLVSTSSGGFLLGGTLSNVSVSSYGKLRSCCSFRWSSYRRMDPGLSNEALTSCSWLRFVLNRLPVKWDWSFRGRLCPGDVARSCCINYELIHIFSRVIQSCGDDESCSWTNTPRVCFSRQCKLPGATQTHRASVEIRYVTTLRGDRNWESGELDNWVHLEMWKPLRNGLKGMYSRSFERSLNDQGVVLGGFSAVLWLGGGGVIYLTVLVLNK